MRISGTEPSSVVLGQRSNFKVTPKADMKSDILLHTAEVLFRAAKNKHVAMM